MSYVLFKIWNGGRRLMQLVSREHIQISSDMRSGKPRIVDTRIAVKVFPVFLDLFLTYQYVNLKLSGDVYL
jgi:hypothetical protein